MIHRMDPPADPDREAMPERILPMLAGAGELPAREEKWSFEVKWDGVRAIAYVKPGRLRLESRNLNEITETYPEVRGILRDLGMREAVFDGEIVAFGDDGRPSFERLQRRINVSSASAVRRLAASTPVVYAIFDLLYLDGHSLMALPYEQRRARLEELGLGGPAWRVPAAHPGRGSALLDATEAQGLEGVVAKRLDSRYEPGRRTGAWMKIKHVRRQELVICGWLPGEGRRTERIGALLMGYWTDDGRLDYAGRVGHRLHRAHAHRAGAQARAAAPRRQPVRRRAQAAAQRGVRRARAGGRDRVSRVDDRGGHARAVVQGAARRQGRGRGGPRAGPGRWRARRAARRRWPPMRGRGAGRRPGRPRGAVRRRRAAARGGAGRRWPTAAS